MKSAANLKLCRSHKCIICTELGTYQEFPTEADHLTTRGAGGGDEQENLWPLCTRHHAERHQIGIRTFVKKYKAARMYLELMGRTEFL